MKILFASRFVDPLDPRVNRNIVRQARVLVEDFGLNIEILTWPKNDLWAGPFPQRVGTLPPLKITREGLTYQVFCGLPEWNVAASGNIISEMAWEDAIEYGMNLLDVLSPDVVHLHHWFGFWWILVSAQRLGIPTVYSNYDWGIACLRTVLVNGQNELCDGVVEPNKCAVCIKTGRTRILGKINEKLADTIIGQKLLKIIDNSSVFGVKFRASGGVSMPVIWRTEMNYMRVSDVMQGLGHCITPSEFGRDFFKQFGIPQNKVTVVPWYHDAVEVSSDKTNKGQPFTITYIGRVSPDKGVHLIFEALEKLQNIQPLQLRIAGANDSEYCLRLKRKYSLSVGKHKVQWQGWSPIDDLLRTTDVTIIPSMWMDNTPLTLLEAIAYHVPIVATAIPTIVSLIQGKGVAYLAEYNSAASLSMAIKAAVEDIDKIRDGAIKFPVIPTANEYGRKLREIYSSLVVCKKSFVEEGPRIK